MYQADAASTNPWPAHNTLARQNLTHMAILQKE